MSRILITGANKGLGRRAAQRLLADGHDVWIAARDPSRARETASEVGGKHVVLDVTDDASVSAAAKTVADGGGLDVLVNNAGIASARRPASEVTAEDIRDVYDVNVFGVVRVLRAFLPLLDRSQSPVVVNVSSGLGSLADVQSVEEGTDAIVQTASIARDGPTATFLDQRGSVAW